MLSFRRFRGHEQPGSMKAWPAGNGVPAGWLAMEGQTVQTADEPRLAHAWGIVASSFTIPDMRDRVPVGAGGDYAVGATMGAKSKSGNVNNHTLTVAQSPAHSHNAAGATGDGGPISSANRTDRTPAYVVPTTSQGSSEAHNHGYSIDVEQRGRAVRWIVKR